MRVLVDIRVEGKWNARIRYTLSTILSTLGVEYGFASLKKDESDGKSLWIVYGSKEDVPVYINRAVNLLYFIACPATNRDELIGLEHLYYFSNEDAETYYFYQANFNLGYGKVIANATASDGHTSPVGWELVSDDEINIVLSADFALSAFALLSRAEEYLTPGLDKHSRYDESQSFLIENKIHNRPLVNEYLFIIESWILKIYDHSKNPYISKAMFPAGKKWGICLSHDVDIMKLWQIYLFGLALGSLHRRDLTSAIHMIFSLLKNSFKRNYTLEVIKHLIALEEKFRFTSTIFLFGSVASFAEVLKAGFSYEVSDKEIASTFSKFANNNHEIALHGSYNSYLNHPKMQNEKRHLEKSIERKITGMRQHFLRFKTPETWEIQEKCDFRYDSTMGFYSTNGFRAGFAMPYQPYNIQNEKTLSIIEMPLILMDRTYTKYQGRNLIEVKKDILEILNQTRLKKGIGSILWHSHMLDCFGMIGYENLYTTILDYLYQNNAYVAPMADFTNWWIDRSKTQIVTASSDSSCPSWQIRCDGEAVKVDLNLVVPSTSRYKIEPESDDILIEECNEHRFLLSIPELKQGKTVHIKLKDRV